MVFETVKGIIVEQLSVNPDDVTMSTSVTDDLCADSLDMVETLMAVEDEFGIEIPDDKVESLKTVGDLVNYIQTETDSE